MTTDPRGRFSFWHMPTALEPAFRGEVLRKPVHILAAERGELARKRQGVRIFATGEYPAVAFRPLDEKHFLFYRLKSDRFCAIIKPTTRKAGEI